MIDEVYPYTRENLKSDAASLALNDPSINFPTFFSACRDQKFFPMRLSNSRKKTTPTKSSRRSLPFNSPVIRTAEVTPDTNHGKIKYQTAIVRRSSHGKNLNDFHVISAEYYHLYG